MEQAVLIGGGQAAHCAAMAMRQQGFAGRIVIVGEEDLLPYERPPLSKAVLLDDTASPPFLARAGRYEECNIELRTGVRVEAIEIGAARLRLSDGGRLAYDRLLIATGGTARRLAVPGGEEIRYLRSFRDALAVQAELARARRILCIGGGVVGLEIAASARARGAEVMVIEVGSALMTRCMTAEDASYMQGLHERAGVTFRFGAGVCGIEAAGAGKRVVLDDGCVLDADCVIAGVGMERNTGLAAEAGLAVDDGIVVDESCRTSVPGVFAAGDVTAFYHPLMGRRMRLESYHHAQGQGTVAGRVMAGAAVGYADIPRFWTDQHGVNLQVAGDPAGAVRTVLRGMRAENRFTGFHIGADGRIVGVTAASNARDMRPAIEMIRKGLRPDEAQLADMGVPLNKIAA